MMKRTSVSGITLTLLLVSMLTFTFNVQLVKTGPNIWYVDNDGSADFVTIQEAINSPNVKDGDTIYVYGGIYYENVVVNKAVSLIGENKSTTIIDGRNSGTIVYISANDTHISGFTVRYSGSDPFSDSGIRIDSSSNIVISGNVIINNTFGIRLEQASNNTISQNIIANITYSGIELTLASNSNVIDCNTITNNRYGIWLERSSENNDIRGNAITGNWKGIRLATTANNNTISSNTFMNNEEGIHLLSNFNSIYENIILNNRVGMYSLESEGNIIYRNNFINNPVQVDMRVSVGVWDNGAEGNHWSDYDGQDLNGDGIGDTLLPHLGLDRYPLVEAWSQFRLFNVTWAERTHHIATFSNSTIASFYFNHSPRQIGFNVTGPSGAVGFFNVTVPKSLLNASWLVLLDGVNVTAETVIVENDTHTFLYLTYGFSTRMVKIMAAEVRDKIPPVALFTVSSKSVLTAVVIHFNASASYDPNGDIVSYFWDFEDGTNATGVLVDHAYTSPGTYNVTLTVKDAANNTDTHTITITVLSPLEVFPWWIVGVVALIGIGVAGIVLWKHKARKTVTRAVDMRILKIRSNLLHCIGNNERFIRD